ncbi:hypothetical protein JMUB6875_73540 [Nocardia sp. JMUB6875]|uniref:cobalamin biosynthesis protein n=1 Tax=Nocardia sp. JMUB6875 TaxID=3158170 RepID=UPI0032E6274A
MPRPELAVGVGLRPGAAAEDIVAAIREVAGDVEIGRLATIDRRASEAGFLRAAELLGAEAVGFSAEELGSVAVPNSSERVGSAVGTGSVAEAAAVLASGGGGLVVLKTIVGGVVIAGAVLGEDI